MRWLPKRKLDIYEWHEWFAWFPVNCDGEMVWWEKVMRIREVDRFSWEGSFYYSSIEDYKLHTSY